MLAFFFSTLIFHEFVLQASLKFKTTAYFHGRCDLLLVHLSKVLKALMLSSVHPLVVSSSSLCSTLRAGLFYKVFYETLSDFSPGWGGMEDLGWAFELFKKYPNRKWQFDFGF
jgi:hypothetical protein